MNINESNCPVCGYYCSGKGGVFCIDKPSIIRREYGDMGSKLRFVVDGDEMIRFLEEHKSLEKEVKNLRETLAWYKHTVSDCNRYGELGDEARDLLAKDVGDRAAKALGIYNG